MDNRYLFRGKRIDNLKKDWAIGHYVSVPRHMIVLAETMLNGNWNCFDVDPATLGQCTGLLAAKSYRGEGERDRLVFEGDVIYESDWEMAFVVFWNNEAAGWFIKSGDSEIEILADVVGECEIIGTIHMHPELLEPKP